MNRTSTCRQCSAALGSDTHAGLCPSCLFQVGIDLMSTPATPADTGTQTDPSDALPCRFGDYELLERIARGGMGVVYKARQISLNRTVALKMILAGELASLEAVQRFHAEAESVANLRHPNIVVIYEIGETDGQHYFSMEYIEGRDLAEMVQDSPMGAKRAARYMQQVAEAVEYAHQHDVLHRDLKPSNVLVDERGEPRVTDFGLAKKLTTDSALTLSGQLLGSPNFMPPEQASSKRGKVGRQSDVYGLGALLYHVLTGRPPFHAATLEETLHQVFEQAPVSPRALNPSVPRDLDTICLKCLEKEPQRRYSTAQAVAEELGRFFRDEPIMARPMSPIGKAWCWCRRKPVVAGLGAAVMLLLLILAVGGPIMAVRQTALVEHTRQVSYASDLVAAWDAWHRGNIAHSKHLLDRHRPRPGHSDLREFTWRYLRNLCLPALEIPTVVNPAPLLLSAVSHDGTRFATLGGPVGSMTIWNAQTKKIESQFTTGVGGAAFSPDGRLLVTTGHHIVLSSSGNLKVWDVATGTNVFRADFGGNPGEFSPNGRWFAFSIQREIVILDADQGWRKIKRWPAHSAGIWEVRWSPDGTRLISAGGDHSAAIWNAESEEELCRLKGHSLPVHNVAFSPDGQIVVTTSEDKTVRFWDAATGVEMERDRYQHAADVYGLAWSRNGLWVASADDKGLVKLRNRKTQSNWTLRGHSQSVKTLRFGLNSTLLISASMDGTIRFWDLARLPPNNDLPGRAGSRYYSPVAFSPRSRFVATVDPNATDIMLWNVATGTLRSRFPISTSDLCTLLPPDEATITRIKVNDLTFVSEDRLAMACEIQLNSPGANTACHRVALYDLQRNVLVKVFPGRAPLQLSPDGERLAMQGEAPRRVQIRDLVTGRTWPDPSVDHPLLASRSLWAFAFSPDGNTLVASVIMRGEENNRKLVLLETATGMPLGNMEGPSPQLPIGVMAFTPDGTRLITGGLSPRVQVWDVRRREFAFDLPGHTAHLRSLAISPDGKTLAVGSEAGVLKLWSLEQWAQLLTLSAHERSINALSFSPDGNTLASGGKEGKVRLWRAVPEP
jgi:eukaryotic-like serine/threonine-protein kinase